jgi:hypothetical protein
MKRAKTPTRYDQTEFVIVLCSSNFLKNHQLIQLQAPSLQPKNVHPFPVSKNLLDSTRELWLDVSQRPNQLPKSQLQTSLVGSYKKYGVSAWSTLRNMLPFAGSTLGLQSDHRPTHGHDHKGSRTQYKFYSKLWLHLPVWKTM